MEWELGKHRAKKAESAAASEAYEAYLAMHPHPDGKDYKAWMADHESAVGKARHSLFFAVYKAEEEGERAFVRDNPRPGETALERAVSLWYAEESAETDRLYGVYQAESERVKALPEDDPEVVALAEAAKKGKSTARALFVGNNPGVHGEATYVLHNRIVTQGKRAWEAAHPKPA